MTGFGLVLTEQYLNATTHMQMLIFWLMVAAACTSILIFGNIVTTAIALAVVCGGILNAYALFSYFSVQVNVISIVNIVFAFGMFVDATSHTVHAFIASSGAGCEKVSMHVCPDIPCAIPDVCDDDNDDDGDDAENDGDADGNGIGGGGRASVRNRPFNLSKWKAGGAIHPTSSSSLHAPPPGGATASVAGTVGEGDSTGVYDDTQTQGFEGPEGAAQAPRPRPLSVHEASLAVAYTTLVRTAPLVATPCYLFPFLRCDHVDASLHVYFASSGLATQRCLQTMWAVVVPLVHAALTTMVSVSPIFTASMEFVRTNFGAVFICFAVISLGSIACTTAWLGFFSLGIPVHSR